VRSFLYHRTCKEGFIYTDQESYDKAKLDGWVEAPWLIKDVQPEPEVEVMPEVKNPVVKRGRKPNAIKKG
jgi:hypothetical protein